MKTKTHKKTEWFLNGESIAIILFLVSRTLLMTLHLFLMPDIGGTDISLYKKYAVIQMEADENGGDVFNKETFEYPPISIIPMMLPAIFAKIKNSSDYPSNFNKNYRAFFKIQAAFWDLLCFIVLLSIVQILFSNEGWVERNVRLSAFVIGGAAVGSTLYARFDLLISLTIIVSIWLLIIRSKPFSAQFVLALGTAFKLVPVIFLPVWVAGCIYSIYSLNTLRAIKMGIIYVAWFFISLASLWVPYIIIYGKRVLVFFQYHKDRGVEIESFWGMVSSWGKYVGINGQIYFSHGSFNIKNGLTESMSKLSSLSVILVCFMGLVMTLILLLKKDTLFVSNKTIQKSPELIAIILFILFGFISLNKVLSPQYLIWLIPLVPLVPLSNKKLIYFIGVFLVACILTSVVTPILWGPHILGRVVELDGTVTFQGPTLLGLFVLTFRNLMLIVLFIWAGLISLRLLFGKESSYHNMGKAIQ